MDWPAGLEGKWKEIQMILSSKDAAVRYRRSAACISPYQLTSSLLFFLFSPALWTRDMLNPRYIHLIRWYCAHRLHARHAKVLSLRGHFHSSQLLARSTVDVVVFVYLRRHARRQLLRSEWMDDKEGSVIHRIQCANRFRIKDVLKAVRDRLTLLCESFEGTFVPNPHHWEYQLHIRMHCSFEGPARHSFALGGQRRMAFFDVLISVRSHWKVFLWGWYHHVCSLSLSLRERPRVSRQLKSIT